MSWEPCQRQIRVASRRFTTIVGMIAYPPVLPGHPHHRGHKRFLTAAVVHWASGASRGPHRATIEQAGVFVFSQSHTRLLGPSVASSLDVRQLAQAERHVPRDRCLCPSGDRPGRAPAEAARRPVGRQPGPGAATEPESDQEALRLREDLLGQSHRFLHAVSPQVLPSPRGRVQTPRLPAPRSSVGPALTGASGSTMAAPPAASPRVPDRPCSTNLQSSIPPSSSPVQAFDGRFD